MAKKSAGSTCSPATGPSGMGSCSRAGITSSSTVSPSRLLNTRGSKIVRWATFISSARLVFQPVTARTMSTMGMRPNGPRGAATKLHMPMVL